MEWKKKFDLFKGDKKTIIFCIVIIILCIFAIIAYSDYTDKRVVIAGQEYGVIAGQEYGVMKAEGRYSKNEANQKLENIEPDKSDRNKSKNVKQKNLVDRIKKLETKVQFNSKKLSNLEYSMPPAETPKRPYQSPFIVYEENTETLKKHLNIDFVSTKKPLIVILKLTQKTNKSTSQNDRFRIIFLMKETYLIGQNKKFSLISPSNRKELEFTFDSPNSNNAKEVTFGFDSSLIEGESLPVFKGYFTVRYAKGNNPMYDRGFMTIDNLSMDTLN